MTSRYCRNHDRAGGIATKKHSDGDIRVAFTPDEEVGKGAKHLMLTPSMPAGLTPLMVVASATGV